MVFYTAVRGSINGVRTSFIRNLIYRRKIEEILKNCDKEQTNSLGAPRKYVESEIVPSLFWTFSESAGRSINKFQ